MGRLALIGGHSIMETALLDTDRRVEVAASGGDVAVLDAESHVLLQRHGLDAYIPPHRIDHGAHMEALCELGCDRILAISSVGSLHPELAVGSLLCPHDFIALHLGPVASHGAEGHRVPGFDPGWRARVLGAWAPAGHPLRDSGVYWQAIGPRFETPAEIGLVAAHADVIGMTVAAECIAAGEAGLAYAAVCVVDNLANGIGPRSLTVVEYEAGRDANRARLEALLPPVLERLARVTP
jgi:5'-methylthioadenosine phosphorylase